MSNETEKTETKAAKSEPKAPADSAGKYSVERLIQDSDPLVGYPSHVVAGALYDAKGDMTVDQAKSAVEKFLNSEVKEG